MASLKQENPFDRLLDNTLVLDARFQLVTVGRTLAEKLLGSKPPRKNFLDHFSDPEERRRIEGELQELKKNRETGSLRIGDQKLTGRYQPLGKGGSLVLFREERRGPGRNGDLDQVEQTLKERVKELTCLYSVSNAIDQATTLKEAIENSLPPIRKGVQFSKIANVTFVMDKNTYRLNDRPEKTAISSDIITHGRKRGYLKVSYSRQETFLKEEKQLIDEISLSFSKTIERVESRADLEKQRKILLRKNKKLLELTEECGQSRTKLEAMLNAMEGRIIMVDRDRNIILSNRPGIKEGDKCFQALFEHSRSCADCPLTRVFNEGRAINIERISNSTYFDLQFFPVKNEKNQVETVLEICKDVTKAKNMEFQLIQSYKLASLGKLIAGIAHEINNPNTFIRGNIRIIQEAMEDIFPILEREGRKDSNLKIARLNYEVFRENIPVLIEDMVEGSERIKKIVYGLRNYARKDEGTLDDDVDINQVVESSLRLVSNQLRKTATVQKRLQEGIPGVKGNLQKLEQVVVNLLVNASQAIPEGQKGVIKVVTDYHEKSNEVTVMVSDNGVGMDQKTRKSIFDPFFTTKRARGGTGLGLSISYGIIKEHNGRIMVNSKEGEGTVFTINLPGDKP